MISDQYMREPGSRTAMLSESTTEAAFSSEAKARAFIEAQPYKNQFGPLYWRVKDLPIDKGGYMIKLEKVKVVWEWDECPDLSWLGEYTNTPGPGGIDRIATEDWGQREYRYFQPGNHVPFNSKDWDHVSEIVKAETIRKYGSLEKASQAYAMQDYKRMEAYRRGHWHMTGCYAEATVSYEIGQGSRRLETFSSGGLWGIESDASVEHKAETAKDELAGLKAHLEVFGVDLSNWDALTEGLEYTEV